jgi:hypothetical protein
VCVVSCMPIYIYIYILIQVVKLIHIYLSISLLFLLFTFFFFSLMFVIWHMYIYSYKRPQSINPMDDDDDDEIKRTRWVWSWGRKASAWGRHLMRPRQNSLYTYYTPKDEKLSLSIVCNSSIVFWFFKNDLFAGWGVALMLMNGMRDRETYLESSFQIPAYITNDSTSNPRERGSIVSIIVKGQWKWKWQHMQMSNLQPLLLIYCTPNHQTKKNCLLASCMTHLREIYECVHHQLLKIFCALDLDLYPNL